MPVVAGWAARAAAGLLFIALAWSVAVQAAIAVLPADLAARFAPGSPAVLTRQAQTELAARRPDAAQVLARRALARQPFSVDALVVLGLARDQRGDHALADDLLTLAGNWSLGEARAHLWLFDRRMRLGDYPSALAHLDAVLRSRPDRRPALFELLQDLALADPAIAAATADRLALAPNWRAPFLAYLGASDAGRGVAATLAASLHAAGKDLTRDETEALLRALLASRDYGRLSGLARRIGVPAALSDPDFRGSDNPLPFRWELLGGAGASVEIVTGPEATSGVLTVQYDGYSADGLVRQLTFLPPGPYRLGGRATFEGDPARLRWAVQCLDSGAHVSIRPNAVAAGGSGSFSGSFEIPPSGCELQWVQLLTDPAERRSEVVAAYESVRIRPIGHPPSG